MSEAKEELARYTAAVQTIVDGRRPDKELGAIMVTLESAVAATLIYVMDDDPRKAAGMLNEGLVPGVEQRIALYEKRQREKNRG